MSKRTEIEAVTALMFDDGGLGQDEVRAELRALGVTKDNVMSIVQDALGLVAEAKRRKLTQARKRMEARSLEERSRVLSDMPRAEVIARLQAMPGVEAFFRGKNENETSTEELRRILEDYLSVEQGDE
ncbi:MAG: hypothetical protein U1E65_21970 [Myxococcota bacterium]